MKLSWAVCAVPPLLFYASGGGAEAQPSIAQPVVPGSQAAAGVVGLGPTFTPFSGTNPMPVTTQTPAATTVAVSATGTTAATAVSIVSPTVGLPWLCGFSIRANATGAATVNATVTFLAAGTLNFTQWVAPLASGIGVVEEQFNPCLPGTNGLNINITSGAAGSGGVTSVSAWGYQR